MIDEGSSFSSRLEQAAMDGGVARGLLMALVSYYRDLPPSAPAFLADPDLIAKWASKGASDNAVWSPALIEAGIAALRNQEIIVGDRLVDAWRVPSRALKDPAGAARAKGYRRRVVTRRDASRDASREANQSNRLEENVAVVGKAPAALGPGWRRIGKGIQCDDGVPGITPAATNADNENPYTKKETTALQVETTSGASATTETFGPAQMNVKQRKKWNWAQRRLNELRDELPKLQYAALLLALPDPVILEWIWKGIKPPKWALAHLNAKQRRDRVAAQQQAADLSNASGEQREMTLLSVFTNPAKLPPGHPDGGERVQLVEIA